MEQFIKFDNGLRLVLVQNNGMFSVSTGMWVESGSSYETPSNNGISHFIEHTLFKGTKKRNSYEISDCIDRVGGQMNAFTTKEATCYYTKTTEEYLELSIDLLSDMLLNAIFEEKELEKERGVILEEISMTEDTPDDLCLDLLSKAYFGNAPLGQTILGTKENIKKFSASDVRDFMKNNYAPNNIVISISGKFDVDNAVSLVKKYFVDQNHYSKFQLSDIPLVQSKCRFISKEKDIEQCHIAFATPSISMKDDKFFEYNILGNIFGGSMTSRLFRAIREDKGLAYTVFAFGSKYKNNGTNVVYAGVNPKNVELATMAIREEFIKLKKDKITKEEFERGKAQTIGDYIFSQENSITTMNVYGKTMLLLDKMFELDNRIKKMKDMTYDDVCGVIDDYTNLQEVSASCVGKSKVDILKIIKGE